jgi:uncharacterized SAM-binding protein YcdF (DUF218 family)
MRPSASSAYDFSRPGRNTRAVSVVVLLAMSASTLVGGLVEPPLTQRLAVALETRIPRADLVKSNPPGGIIVLGGSNSRVIAALQLARQFPHAQVILSGPGASEVAFAKAHIPDPARLIVDRRARNTYENALYSRDLLKTATAHHWAVVTSAVHMPRAVASFEAAGLPIAPWPVYDTPRANETLSKSVWHEILGLVGYWILGRTNTLFPKAF